MSSNHKRKRTDDDESDEEPAYGMRQILPVANLPADFSGEPSDGMQYLFTVRRDAQKLPNVKYVPNPYDIPIVSSHDVDDVFDVKPQVGEAYTLPSAEWRDTFVRRFRNFRENMKQPTIGLQRPPQRRQVPEKANRDAWWAFLSGAPESHWNPPAKKQKRQARQRRGNAGNTLDPSDPAVLEAGWELVTPVSIASSASSSYEPPREPDLVSSTTSSDQPGETEDAGNEVSTSAVSSSGERFQSKSPREPTPAFLQGIDHRFSLHLLMYFAHWITLHVEYLEGSHASAEAYTIYETHARWIFSLLARVDAFCTSDDTSTLRTLVRACLSLLRARHFPTQDDGHDSLASTPGPEAEDPQASANMAQTSYNQDASKSTVKTEENTPAELRDESVWLILAAVAEFWGQRDLWDDAQVLFSQTS